MVEVGTKQPGLLKKIAQPIVNFWRGYSSEELKATVRQYRGLISDEDRALYLQRQEILLKIAYGSDQLQLPGNSIQSAANSYLLNEKTNELNQLSPAEIDVRIKNLAENRLMGWNRLEFLKT